jgi:hypothetical protein
MEETFLVRLMIFAVVLSGFGLASHGVAHATTVNGPCSSANELFKEAGASSAAAENEKAVSLYQNAVEAFELCRPSENPKSTQGLNDTLTEALSQLYAASFLYEGGDSGRAVELMVGADSLLVQACMLYVNPPYQTRSLLAAAIFLMTGTNRIHNAGFDFSTLSQTCVSNWSTQLPKTP